MDLSSTLKLLVVLDLLDPEQPDVDLLRQVFRVDVAGQPTAQIARQARIPVAGPLGDALAAARKGLPRWPKGYEGTGPESCPLSSCRGRAGA